MLKVFFGFTSFLITNPQPYYRLMWSGLSFRCLLELLSYTCHGSYKQDHDGLSSQPS
uniref:Uncharacterized protein n=1 Tax=Triticum urartu TaxID=4572 RepID=A0A8R7TIE0_TRIUA